MAGAQRLKQIEEGHTVVLGEVKQENPQHFQVLDQGLGLGSQLMPQGVQVVTDGLDRNKAKHNLKNENSSHIQVINKASPLQYLKEVFLKKRFVRISYSFPVFFSCSHYIKPSVKIQSNISQRPKFNFNIKFHAKAA